MPPRAARRAFPRIRVVTTLNTLNADLMVDPVSLGAEPSVFVSGNDDAEAMVKSSCCCPCGCGSWRALNTAASNVEIVR